MQQLLTDEKLESSSEALQEAHVMGIIWSILQIAPSGHPGKIADYVGVTDFAVNLSPRDTGYQAHIEAEFKFDA
jgi:hypothetical protein